MESALKTLVIVGRRYWEDAADGSASVAIKAADARRPRVDLGCMGHLQPGKQGSGP
jgi:hypothetical protein